MPQCVTQPTHCLTQTIRVSIQNYVIDGSMFILHTRDFQAQERADKNWQSSQVAGTLLLKYETIFEYSSICEQFLMLFRIEVNYIFIIWSLCEDASNENGKMLHGYCFRRFFGVLCTVDRMRPQTIFRAKPHMFRIDTSLLIAKQRWKSIKLLTNIEWSEIKEIRASFVPITQTHKIVYLVTLKLNTMIMTKKVKQKGVNRRHIRSEFWISVCPLACLKWSKPKLDGTQKRLKTGLPFMH